MTRRTVQAVRAVMLLAGAGLLAGCVYDPYTGAYYPCCPAPYPDYYYTYPGYAPYYAPYNGDSYQYPPPYYPPPGYAGAPYGPAPYAPAVASALAQRFAEANATHDGRLTLQQAQAAQWLLVARNFPAIDVEHKGYVTLNEIRVWLETHPGEPDGMHG